MGRRARPRRGPPPGPALAPRQGQVSGCGDSGARARGGGEVRGRQPGASARLCPAGAPLWRAADTLPAPGSAAADFSWRARKAERGCERQRVCVARAGAGASPDPTPSSAPPRVSALRGPSPCGPRSEAEGLSPRASSPPLWRERGSPSVGCRGLRRAGAPRRRRRRRGARRPLVFRGRRGCERVGASGHR